MKSDIALVTLFAILGAPVLMMASILYSVWAWSITSAAVFGWFLHPMFPHLAMPSQAQLIAVSIVVNVLWGRRVATQTTPDVKGGAPGWVVNLGVGFLAPWVFLVAAWVVSNIYRPLPYVIS